MTNYIELANFNIQGGILSGEMKFQSGLNIISGENGTLKTKALQALKSEQVKFFDPSQPCRRQAISPKRNAQRRAFRQIYEQSRRNNIKIESIINERNINDAAFEEYPALGDLFYVVYEELCKDGGNQIEKMAHTASEFNEVIHRIFPHYELIAEWNTTTGSPDIDLLKHNNVRVPLEGLSLGEQEILSLAINIYASRDRYDVFLIDEPEVHLNWHLEEKFFEFFDDYCMQYHRQMIIVTHSRVIFSRRFFSKTQFFYWNESGRVSISDDVTSEQRRRIAGDAIEIIRLGEFDRPTFFVEDDCQARVVNALCDHFNIDASVVECGNKSNIRSLYKYSLTDSQWTNSYFLEDGDNEGNPFPNDPRFVHLTKYCMESHLLNVPTISGILRRPEIEIRNIILNTIHESREQIFRKNKFFEFLLDHLHEEHLTQENLAKLDGSVIFDDLLSAIDKDRDSFVGEYIAHCAANNTLENVFSEHLITAIRGCVVSSGGESS